MLDSNVHVRTLPYALLGLMLDLIPRNSLVAHIARMCLERRSVASRSRHS